MSLARYPGSGNGGDGGYPAPLTIQAEDYTDMSGIEVLTDQPNYGGTGYVGSFTTGDWVSYAGVNCGKGVNTFTWRVNTSATYYMELRLGSNTGPVIARPLFPPNTGWGNWDEYTWTTCFPTVRGVQTFALVCPTVDGGWQTCQIDAVRFSWTDALGG